MKPIHILLPLLLLMAACKGKQQPKVTMVAKADTVTVYTCSMHPQIIRYQPGNCPICGMTLIQASTSKSIGNDEIQLTNQQIQLGNIVADTIHSSMLGNPVTLTATLNFDQKEITAISSRVMGRIEKLYFKSQGDYVKKGDKLYDLYSEDLNNAKSEYILVIEKKATLDNSVIDFDQLIRSAKNKLLLWGLSESQIQQLATSKKAGTTTSFYSNEKGSITSLDVKEGDYVMEGGAILHLTDLSTLWVEAQLYSSEQYKINKAATAEVQIPEMGRKPFNGKIEFLNSELTPGTRINLMRISIPNNNNELKPGMAAYVTITNPKHNMLSLPIDAVLRDGNTATIWVMRGDRVFKNVMVDVGMENGDRIEIKSGLMDGDVVVITGTYLLNSEYIFKKGANPMAGMKM
jgi:Cu(I)/Ag(I) efflux system membrane fusion protein